MLSKSDSWSLYMRECQKIIGLSELSTEGIGDEIALFCFGYPSKKNEYRFESSAASRLLAMLTPAERSRFSGLSTQAADRFLISRTAIRLVLARFLRCEPYQVPLAINSSGKIYVVGSPYFISLAHSGNKGILAVAPRNVGIDLERLGGGCGRRADLLSKLTARLAKEAFIDEDGSDARSEYKLVAWWTMYESMVKYYGASVWRCERLTYDDRRALGRFLKANQSWFDQQMDAPLDAGMAIRVMQRPNYDLNDDLGGDPDGLHIAKIPFASLVERIRPFFLFFGSDRYCGCLTVKN